MTPDYTPHTTTSSKETIVYVDGLNLYYGALRGTAHKWLDIEKLCRRLLPRDTIVGIKYFTARVTDTPGNPGAAQRQNVYLRALRTLEPLVSIHYGLIRRQSKRMYLAKDRTRKVKVIEYQEKQTDVNLASRLVRDASQGSYEKAAVMSNDSDLTGAIRLVEEEAGLPVTAINPDRRGVRASNLSASAYRTIRSAGLACSQFPDELEDSQGAFRRPSTW